MQKEDNTPRVRVFLGWLKANFVSVLITVILVAAAALSVTYAYLNGRTPEHVPNPVSQLDIKEFAYAPEAQTIPVESSEDDTPTGGGNNSSPQPSSQPAVNSPQESHSGETLGVMVSCKEVEKQAYSALQETLERNILLPDGVVEDAYNLYATILRSKGCTPMLTLDEVLRRIGGGLVGSLRSLL